MTGPAGATLAVGDFALESGEVLHDLKLAYAVAGRLAPARDNVVLVVHALTGRHADLGGWWPDVIGPGRALDTREHAVVCVNLPGSCYGTTYWGNSAGAGEPHGSPPGRLGGAPPITTRDMARALALVLRHLRIESLELVTGGSLGGMVALELLATFPDLARGAVVFAAPAAHTAWGIGWNHLQRRLVERLGEEGLALARMAGMLTYRTPRELEERFARNADDAHGFAVRSWLAHHGDKLTARFSAPSYLRLLDAMDSHDVARGRGSLEAAFAPVSAHVTGVGIPGDALYPEEDVRAWVDAARGTYRRLPSAHGHDGFLLESEAVGALLREALATVRPDREQHIGANWRE